LKKQKNKPKPKRANMGFISFGRGGGHIFAWGGGKPPSPCLARSLTVGPTCVTLFNVFIEKHLWKEVKNETNFYFCIPKLVDVVGVDVVVAILGLPFVLRPEMLQPEDEYSILYA